MYGRLTLALFAAGPLLSGCSEVALGGPVAYQATLAPVGAANIVASVAAVAQPGQPTEAGITVQYAPAPATLGWEIRAGTCASPGVRVGGRGAYPDLTVGADGSGSIQRTFINAAMPPELPFHAVVVDAETRSTVIACGGLQAVQF